MGKSLTASTGAQRVVVRKVDDLLPYARNARTHSADQVAMIAASIDQFGFNAPVLTDGEGGILAGHGRVLAARHLGVSEVPTIPLDHLSPDEQRAYILADNRIAEHASWDRDMLSLEVADLAGLEFDLGAIGFDDKYLADLLTAPEPEQAGIEGEDDTPAAPVDPVSCPGDIWLLGPHRMGCGDSCDAEFVAAVLAGSQPNLMVTDPPYGVNYNPEWRGETLKADGTPRTARATGKVLNDDNADWSDAWALFTGDIAYVWHSSSFASVVESSLTVTSFEIRSQIVWVKPRLVISRGHYHWRHEPCWYAVRKGKAANWKGDRKQTTIWEIDHRKSKSGHGTEKPVEAMRRPIQNHTDPGDAVYDPFLGSGTTLIAADSIDRICFGQELNPAYCDVIIRRWQEQSGAAATLEATGQTFDAVTEHRLAQAA